MINDHLTDPDAAAARRHELIERARDHTHTSNLTGGQLVDLLGRVGCERIEFREEAFELDFDEWFDRGSSIDSKENVRTLLLTGPSIRGFVPAVQPDSSIRIDCLRGLIKGVKPLEQATSEKVARALVAKSP